MDVFSHGLWSGAVYKAINLKTKKPLKVWLAVFWGVAPDVFAFAISFSWLLWKLFSGEMSPAEIPPPEEAEPIQHTMPLFQLSNLLYSMSHSLFMFFLIFSIVFLLFRRPVWEMGAWLIHILIDIPTHSYKFFPTPFLWPISDWKFDGFSWGTPWFIIINYSAIIIIYFILRRKNKLKQNINIKQDST